MIETSKHSLKTDIEDVSFNLLMKKRINTILLICTKYDAFILEEDGRIDEQIFNEYSSLGLNYPPQFKHVETEKEALFSINNDNIDLVIMMPGVEEIEFIKLASNIKKINSNIPVVVLSSFSSKIQLLINEESNYSDIDFVFNWLGNADILLAIVKLIEDRLNIDHDVLNVGIQAIILVEDTVKYYSMYLPLMYKLIFKQSKEFMSEGLNEHQKMLTLRGRPKIILSTNYEQAILNYEKYKHNLLGIVSDVEFNINGNSVIDAGIQLAKKIKRDNPDFPIILQSSEVSNEVKANEINVGFVCKEDDNISFAFTSYFKENFAFGDFIFRNPSTLKEIDRANNLKTLQKKIFKIDDKSFEYHFKRNDLPKWLKARSLFAIANIVKDIKLESFSDIDSVKRYIHDSISSYRLYKLRGLIAEYNRDSFDDYFVFSRIGKGSIGGKARGLAFADSIMKKNDLINQYKDVIITIPRTVVLTTEIFDEFMEMNNLYDIAYSDISDEEMLKHFVSARFPTKVHQDMLAFVSVIKKPIAVRSSSLLEDSLHQPFAGIYSTYMIPFEDDDRKIMNHLNNAIKCVYASVYYKASKSYMKTTANLINEEKMAIVLQEVCGNKYDDLYYPAVSGVARSLNYYPLDDEKPNDGVVNIAMGLGSYVMNGGVTLRFCPEYPKKILQLSSVSNTLRETQKSFNALCLDSQKFQPSDNDAINISKCKIKNASKSVLNYVASVYDINNERIVDGTHVKGSPVITFSNILKHNSFPLAEILKQLLKIGEEAFKHPVEIEFAINLDTAKHMPKIFNFLQIRPIVDKKENNNFKFDNVQKEEILIYSDNALGNGSIQGIKDVLYVKPESFNSLKSQEISFLIEKINSDFVEKNKKYILIGPGRWGSSDPNLGIPVKWHQISNAKVIIESGLDNYRIDASQGTHFFHNLISLDVAYFTINPFINEGIYDVNYLNNQKSTYENEYLRHVSFEKEFQVEISGSKNIGIIIKQE